nr:MAG TPA: hypothetical protein [Caudoviricetes sp.]
MSVHQFDNIYPGMYFGNRFRDIFVSDYYFIYLVV